MTAGFQVRPASAAIGAFVEDFDLSQIVGDASVVADLKAAVIEHQVVFLPNQPVSPAEFAQLAAQWGEPLDHPAYSKIPEAACVQVLESLPDAPSKIELWHTDMTFTAQPPSLTLLHAQIVPPVGGDTLWASAVAAFEALSDPMQRMLRELRAVHDFRQGFRESLAEPGGAERLADAVAANPPVTHPVVRRHGVSGREAIYVNPLFTTHIEGLSRLESHALLQFLYRQVTTEEFMVRLRWQPQMLAIWDNRSTQHRPVNDFGPAPRRHHRITLKGTEGDQ